MASIDFCTGAAHGQFSPVRRRDPDRHRDEAHPPAPRQGGHAGLRLVPGAEGAACPQLGALPPAGRVRGRHHPEPRSHRPHRVPAALFRPRLRRPDLHHPEHPRPVRDHASRLGPYPGGRCALRQQGGLLETRTRRAALHHRRRRAGAGEVSGRALRQRVLHQQKHPVRVRGRGAHPGLIHRAPDHAPRGRVHIPRGIQR